MSFVVGKIGRRVRHAVCGLRGGGVRTCEAVSSGEGLIVGVAVGSLLAV